MEPTGSGRFSVVLVGHSGMLAILPQAAKKGWTALHFAAFLMDETAIDILLSHNCNTRVLTQVKCTKQAAKTSHFTFHFTSIVHCS